MRSLHVAAAQVHSGGTIRQTLQRIARQAACAAAAGAEVVLFSEQVLGGCDYTPTRRTLARRALHPEGEVCGEVVATARRLGLAILVGFTERDGRELFNSVLVARPDGPAGVQRKHNVTEIERAAGIRPGPVERTVFVFGGVRTAVLICADTGIEGMAERLAAQGVEYRFIPTGGGGKIGDYLHEADLRTAEGRKRYADNRPRVFNTEAVLDLSDWRGIGFTSANALGPVGRSTCHQGHCMIVDNLGVMRAQLPGTIVLEHQQDQTIHAVLHFPPAGGEGATGRRAGGRPRSG